MGVPGCTYSLSLLPQSFGVAISLIPISPKVLFFNFDPLKVFLCYSMWGCSSSNTVTVLVCCV